MKRLFDKSVWVVGLSALLTLSGLSFVFCPTAHAGGLADPGHALVQGEEGIGHDEACGRYSTTVRRGGARAHPPPWGR